MQARQGTADRGGESLFVLGPQEREQEADRHRVDRERGKLGYAALDLGVSQRRQHLAGGEHALLDLDAVAALGEDRGLL